MFTWCVPGFASNSIPAHQLCDNRQLLTSKGSTKTLHNTAAKKKWLKHPPSKPALRILCHPNHLFCRMRDAETDRRTSILLQLSKDRVQGQKAEAGKDLWDHHIQSLTDHLPVNWTTARSATHSHFLNTFRRRWSALNYPSTLVFVVFFKLFCSFSFSVERAKRLMFQMRLLWDAMSPMYCILDSICSGLEKS